MQGVPVLHTPQSADSASAQRQQRTPPRTRTREHAFRPAEDDGGEGPRVLVAPCVVRSRMAFHQLSASSPCVPPAALAAFASRSDAHSAATFSAAACSAAASSAAAVSATASPSAASRLISIADSRWLLVSSHAKQFEHRKLSSGKAPSQSVRRCSDARSPECASRDTSMPAARWHRTASHSTHQLDRA